MPQGKKPINPLNEKQFSSLKESIEWSNQQLLFPRKKRIQSIESYVGMHYSENGSARVMPVNMLKVGVDIYVRQLAARAPRVMITTKYDELKVTAADFELALNQIPMEIGLGETLRRFVMEALFSMGILKIGLSTVGEVLGHSYGETFVDNVTIDDYFCDMSAKDKRLFQYEGNDYWLDYEEVMDSKWGNQGKGDLKPDEYTVLGPAGEKRAEGITNQSSPQVFRDRVLFRDVWLPSEELFLTYGVRHGELLNVVEWEGPENGPYIKLGYSNVPGNIMPLPPVAVWRDLNDLGNAVLRKLGNQADSEKTVQGFGGGDDEAVEAFKNAKDGDGIKWTGTQPERLQAGGVNPRTLAFYMITKELSSYVGGNLDSLGGLSPMSETIGQDRLLSEAAGVQLRDMAAETISTIRKVFYSLAWYEWNNPVKTRKLEKRVPETDVSIPVKWNRDSKKGKFELFDLDIDVYSLQDDSPNLKLRKLNAIMSQFIIPLHPLIQQQQGTIDVQAILRDVARFSDTPEVNEYVTFVDQPMQQGGGGSDSSTPGAPPSSPEAPQSGSAQGGSADLVQQLLSSGGSEGGY